MITFQNVFVSQIIYCLVVRRVRGVSADQEETLLLQLREITRVMQERHLVEGVAPEKKAEDWEGTLG